MKNPSEPFQRASPPVLAYPDFNCPFILTTYASGVGLGTVLSQIQIVEERVICYASRSFKAVEKKYSAIERELRAIVWSALLFRPYLYNADYDVYTDHNPLVYLNNLTANSNRLTKWRLRLAELKFTVRYKKGSENINADTLSWINNDPKEENDVPISALFDQ